MASYDIIFKPSVEKDLRTLPRPVVARVMQRIDTLKDDPFPRQSIKLTGAEQLYRMRVGDYRVIYGVDIEAKRITVHYVRHRREAYRNL
jgi:mRNA interferase RelE/StbE